MAAGTKAGRTRVERGIYRQPNGKLAVRPPRRAVSLPHHRQRAAGYESTG
jgi:hypothetical protein